MKKIWLALSIVLSFFIFSDLKAQAAGQSAFTDFGRDIPPPPTVNKVTTDDFFITGKGVPMKKIVAVVNFPGGARVYTATVDSNGDFSIDLKRKLQEGIRFYVYQVGSGGLFGETVLGTVTQPETNKPSTPIVNPVYEKDRVVTGKADPNINVRVTINGRVYSGATTGEGEFYIPAGGPYPKGTKISVISVKGTSQSEEAVTYVLANSENPTTSLKMPTITPVTTTTYTVYGKADANVFVRLKINNDVYQATTDRNGDFKINLDQLYSAGDKIEAYAYDKAGNKSETLLSEVSQDDFKIGIDYITTADAYLTGKGLANTLLEVQIGNRIYSSRIDSLGDYSIKLARAYEAGTSVTVTASDPSSGKSEVKSTLIYPRSPAINSVTPGTDRIHGQADPGGYVTVYLGGKTYSGRANETGYYHIYVSEKDTVSGRTLVVFQTKNNLSSRETSLTI